MLKRNFLIVAIMAIVSVFAVVSIAHAQDVTPQPTAEVTAIVTAPAPLPDQGPNSVLTPQLVTDIFAVLSFLAAGFALGRYRPGEVARELERNKLALDSAERVALNTIPVTALDTIRGIIADVKVIADVAGKITDGLPNEVQASTDSVEITSTSAAPPTVG